MAEIRIPIASDTREFSSNVTKGVIKPLDDIDEALEKVEKAGDRAGDELIESFQKAQKEVSDFKREQADAARETSKRWKKAGDDVGDAMKDGTRDASEGVETLKENVGSNAKEMAASFDGSVDSMVDGVQGLIAEMTEGFGPAGLAAGVIAAAGIGLVVAEGQKAADSINQAKERAGELALEIIDAGGDLSKVDIAGKMRDWGVEIADNVEWWEVWQKSATSNLQKAEQAAKDFGVEASDMFKAMSGMDPEAARRVLQELTSDLEDLQDQARKNAQENPFAGFSDNADIDFRTTALRNQIGELERMSGVSADAEDSAARLTEITAELTAQQEAATRAEEARTSAISALQGEIDGAISAYGEFTDAETGATDPAGFIANMDARRNAVANFNGNVQALAEQFGLSQDEMQYVLDQGLNFAPMLQSIIDSGMQGQFAEQVRLSVGGGQEILDGSNLNATVNVKADQEPAEAAITAVEEKDRQTQVKAEAKTDDAEKRLADTAAKERVATITARLDSSRFDSDIAAITSRARSITITARVVDQSGKAIRQ